MKGHAIKALKDDNSINLIRENFSRNISKLKKRDYSFIGPSQGMLACGEFGEGRMSNLDEIKFTIQNYLFKKKYDLKAIVTAGPTREYIDPVRYISNESSGIQGYQIAKKLQPLYDVGLSYIKLGQSSSTLSGGEAQRIKLSKELSKRDTGKTLYILDEPTTGLHFSDIQMLMDVLNSLVNKGNSVLVIEHNLDVIKCSDWIIDLGPEGGDGGGNIVAEGNLKKIMSNKKSYTGKVLKTT